MSGRDGVQAEYGRVAPAAQSRAPAVFEANKRLLAAFVRKVSSTCHGLGHHRATREAYAVWSCVPLRHLSSSRQKRSRPGGATGDPLLRGCKRQSRIASGGSFADQVVRIWSRPRERRCSIGSAFINRLCLAGARPDWCLPHMGIEVGCKTQSTLWKK